MDSFGLHILLENSYLQHVAGHPTYHVNMIKLKWEIIWTGELPRLSGLSHLPGPPTFM